MNRILQTGRTSLDAIQRKMDTISNNIANAQTTGYKSMKVQFEDLVYDEIANKGVPLSPEAREKPIVTGTGSKVKNIERQFDQGIPQETSNSLDLAIEGEGFFAVTNENGELFLTRDGSFSLDGEGQLVDSRGNHVVMENGFPLSQWQESEITINERGVLFAENQTGQSMQIGRIPLFNVPDKDQLISKGENYFSTENVTDIVTNEEGAEGWGSIHQGFLEASSVDIGEELVDMLITQRAYEINIRSIHSADEMWSMVNQLRR